MTGARHSRLVVAIAVALAVHAAALAGVSMKISRPDVAADPGTGSVMLLIATTAAGSSAGREKLKQEASADPIRQEALDEPEPEPETVAPVQPVQQINLEKQPQLKPVVQAMPVEKVSPQRSRPIPVPKRKPVHVQPAAVTPVPVTSDRPHQATATAPRPADLSAAISGDQGVSRQTQIARSGGGEISAHGDYIAAVRKWLQEQKRYPRRARVRMIRGEAMLSFMLDRSGRVVSYELRKSTGHDVLDREVLAMIRRASPMPPFPPGLRREKMDFNVPVNFDMR